MADTRSALDKKLAQLAKKHTKAREVLEDELSSERAQAESARSAKEGARVKLQELEAKRPRLGADVFSGKAKPTELEDLDKEMGELEKQMEIGGLAEEQSTEREQEIAKRQEAAEYEAAEARYDLYATERKEGTLGLEKALDALVCQLGALLELDRLQRAEEPNLGLMGGDMGYAEVLDNHLSVRLGKYIRAAGTAVAMMDMRLQRATLLEKDFRTQTRSEAKASVAAEVQEAGEHAARQARAQEDTKRREALSYRRAQLRVNRGYETPGLTEGRRRQIDAEVNALLAEDYGDLLEEERQASLEQRKQEVRATLLSPGEDYASLPEERRAEVDAAVEEWVADRETLARVPGVQ